jgi:hypothetical protein
VEEIYSSVMSMMVHVGIAECSPREWVSNPPLVRVPEAVSLNKNAE